jgi:hypothetical protein
MASGASTTSTRYLKSLVVTGWLVALASPAGATTFAKFYTGTTGYAGPFNGAGTVYNATKSMSTVCPTVGSCSGDNVQTTIHFGTTGITGTALVGSNPSKVWDDLSPHFGGVGVGSGSPTDTDQIAGNDVLVLTFSSKVHLTGVATLFDSAHTPFGNNFQTPGTISNTQTFLIDDGDGLGWRTVSFFNANTLALDLTGTTFKFKENGSNNPEFYISALAYDLLCGPGTGLACGNSNPNPIPGTLPLFATGIGGGLIWLRRRRSKIAA